MRGVLLDPRTGRPTDERADVEAVRRSCDIEELARLHEREWKPRLGRMLRDGELLAAGEGNVYHETRAPYTDTADFPTITLSTTSLMLWASAGSPTATGAGYWQIGKKIEIHLFGKFTTAATPGNLTIEIRYGTTDNGGTILATSAAVALTAAKTSISWHLECQIEARANIGSAAGLFAWGKFIPDQAGLLIPAASNPLLIPASAGASVNVDTTVASGINIQMKRSGSTVETVTVQDRQINALT
jgi:hypothetical protein